MKTNGRSGALPRGYRLGKLGLSLAGKVIWGIRFRIFGWAKPGDRKGKHIFTSKRPGDWVRTGDAEGRDEAWSIVKPAERGFA